MKRKKSHVHINHHILKIYGLRFHRRHGIALKPYQTFSHFIIPYLWFSVSFESFSAHFNGLSEERKERKPVV